MSNNQLYSFSNQKIGSIYDDYISRAKDNKNSVIVETAFGIQGVFEFNNDKVTIEGLCPQIPLIKVKTEKDSWYFKEMFVERTRYIFKFLLNYLVKSSSKSKDIYLEFGKDFDERVLTVLYLSARPSDIDRSFLVNTEIDLEIYSYTELLQLTEFYFIDEIFKKSILKEEEFLKFLSLLYPIQSSEHAYILSEPQGLWFYSFALTLKYSYNFKVFKVFDYLYGNTALISDFFEFLQGKKIKSEELKNLIVDCFDDVKSENDIEKRKFLLQKKINIIKNYYQYCNSI